ncbi:MAG: ThiF family adenylyltransferase [Bacteriovorax sp.]|nr:ThiF family adenylyltransferase [Bacteriovorax sp.]
MSYKNLFQRNIGFVNESEQDKIQKQKVYIVGVGGMGGAALMNLVRMGYENIGVADIDSFEESNINRQLFCSTDTLGMDKAEASVMMVKKLNPAVNIKNWGHDWISKLDEICREYPIIVNGCDDIVASNILYNAARKFKCTVIDAYTASVPSVYVTRPSDPSPLTRWTGLSEINSSDKILIDQYKVKETEYVMTNSNSLPHIHLDIAIEMISGKRSRMSLSPMVISTGCLMAYQVLFLTIDKKATNYHGYFLDPYGKVTKNSFGPIHFIKKILVKFFLKKWLSE